MVFERNIIRISGRSFCMLWFFWKNLKYPSELYVYPQENQVYPRRIYVYYRKKY